MRAAGCGVVSEAERVVLTFDGSTVVARRGETIAAALSAAGVLDWRQTRSGARRGLFCGMGVCQDCLISADGRPVRACMTRVEQPMALASHPHPAMVPATAAAQPSRPPLAPEVLVVGAGVAGMSAALAAARLGAAVTLLDERPAAGGQFYKQLMPSGDLPYDRLADRQMQQGRKLVEAVRAAAVEVISGAEVVAAFEPLDLIISHCGAPQLLRPKRLIVATGAYEIAPAIPGWTLPGVMTTGALQTLLRSYRVVPGRRVVIAGNGPLNLQVAVELARAGAQLVAVAEAAAPPWSAPAPALIGMAAASPRLARDGVMMLAELKRRGVPVRFRSVLKRLDSVAEGIAVTMRSADRPADDEMIADVVGIGYGFSPRSEILGLIGCRVRRDPAGGRLIAETDDDGRTSVPEVFAAGDCVGLGGAAAAALAGTLAGRAAAGDLRVGVEPGAGIDAALRRQLAVVRRFQANLWRVYRPQVEIAEGLQADALACRCEEVSHGELAVANGGPIGNLKRLTRAGMGRCQGRYCERTALTVAGDADVAGGWLPGWAPRPPVTPTSIGTFAELELTDD